MAQLVLGIGTSHSPQMSTPADLWGLHAERDQDMDSLWYQGKDYTFDALREVHPRAAKGPPSQEEWTTYWERCNSASGVLEQELQDASLDVLVIVGNDHKEFFPANVPALSVFTGEAVLSLPQEPESVPPSIRPALWARQSDGPEAYRCDPELSLDLVRHFMNTGFDVTALEHQSSGRSLGHAFTHVRRRLMPGVMPPLVPVIINSYYSPSQPTPSRCLQIGDAIRDAILGWPSELRVGVVASGGLTHFVIDEELDRSMLEAMGTLDRETLGSIDESLLVQGTAESRHWIVAAAALSDLEMRVVDYVAAYRTMAGTGCGHGFAVWSPPPPSTNASSQGKLHDR